MNQLLVGLDIYIWFVLALLCGSCEFKKLYKTFLSVIDYCSVVSYNIIQHKYKYNNTASNAGTECLKNNQKHNFNIIKFAVLFVQLERYEKGKQ